MLSPLDDQHIGPFTRLAVLNISGVPLQDVGLSKILVNESTMMTSFQGTFEWAPPELINGGECSEKADIYSIGVILWEIVTAERPYRKQFRAARYGKLPRIAIALCTKRCSAQTLPRWLSQGPQTLSLSSRQCSSVSLCNGSTLRLTLGTSVPLSPPGTCHWCHCGTSLKPLGWC